jgi:predicted Zn-ribbon and HTH transcriptional regulator
VGRVVQNENRRCKAGGSRADDYDVGFARLKTHRDSIGEEGVLTYRRDLLAVLRAGPRTASSLARELGLERRDIEGELRHVLRSARAAGESIAIEPARCKTCGFVFDGDRLTKPGRCPECRGSRIYEPLISITTS